MDWLHADSYGLARLVLQRGIGLVYVVAFAVALAQFRPLLGDNGLLPIPRFLARVSFREAPSLFHAHYSDRFFAIVCGVGLGLSALIVSGVPARWPVAGGIAIGLVVWALYLSIVNVGQRFYGFGWETLLCEAGFLAAFLGPVWAAPPALILWAFRWLLLRVELGAGLIKLRGDPCWRDLTCLYYHHETQPMPNPLSWWFHRLPKPLHRAEVLGSHLAQLVAPALLVLPQPIAGYAACFMAITQAWLVLSGNFSWLNLVTIVLCASAMNDRLLGHAHAATSTSAALDVVTGLVAALVLVLSYRPARNLVSSDQLMNASFDPLHLVNTYGAFGSVGKERVELVIEGCDHDGTWREYELPGKPTDPAKRPRQFAPWHLRLDWMLWFAALSPAREMPWLLRFLGKLLVNDRSMLRLVARNPFPDRPPEAIRARLFDYRFTTWAERRASGAWWKRTYLRDVVGPMTDPPRMP